MDSTLVITTMQGYKNPEQTEQNKKEMFYNPPAYCMLSSRSDQENIIM